MCFSRFWGALYRGICAFWKHRHCANCIAQRAISERLMQPMLRRWVNVPPRKALGLDWKGLYGSCSGEEFFLVRKVFSSAATCIFYKAWSLVRLCVCKCLHWWQIRELAKDKDLTQGNIVTLATQFSRQKYLLYGLEDNLAWMNCL